MKTSRVAFLALALFAATNVRAASVVVLPVRAVNLEPGEAAAIGTLLAQSYARLSGQEVLGPDITPAKEGSPSAAAPVQGASETIECTAVGLMRNVVVVATGHRGAAGLEGNDSKIILQAVRRGPGGETIYAAELVALGMADIDDVTKRLAAALFEKRPAQETRTLDTVTRFEGAPTNRTFTRKVFGVRTAAIVPVATGISYQPTVALAFDGRLESRNYFLEFGAGFTAPASSRHDAESLGSLFAEIGASYFLANDTVSPYIGAGVSPRILLANESGVSLAPYLQLGLMFPRESTSRLYVDLRAAQNVLPIGRGDDSGRDVYPTELGLQAGIGW
jgi:hypothetical protein